MSSPQASGSGGAAAIDDAMARAVQAHRAGRTSAAETIYSAVLGLAPAHPTALHLRGFARLQQGRAADGLCDLIAATRRNPGNAQAWAHLAACRLALGTVDALEAAARRALTLEPAMVDAWGAIVQATLDAGAASAPTLARHALMVTPGAAGAWHRLGLARLRSGAPPSPRWFRNALLIAPADGLIWADLSQCLRRLREAEGTERAARFGHATSPVSAAARTSLAWVLFDQDRISSAETQARSAAVLAPQYPSAYGVLSESAHRVGDFGAALRPGTHAAILEPRDDQAFTNLAAYHLGNGDITAGWRLFTHRWGRRRLIQSGRLPGKPWSGETGARLLVYAEQGLGDEILFATCWPDLQARLVDGRLEAVRVEVDERLIPLGRREQPLIDWVPRLREAHPAPGSVSAADRGFAATHHIAAGDFAALSRPTLDAFPVRAGGLAPDPIAVAQWRTWLDRAAPGQRRIGICWRSGSRAGQRSKHYPDIEAWRPLFDLPNRRFVVLQYDDCAEEVARVREHLKIDLLVPPHLDRRDDQDGVAALIRALDTVVSGDTAVLALAGALGAPSVGYTLGPGWVCLGQGKRHPWFPNLERVIKPPEEPWSRTMTRVAAAETALAQAATR
ncbi:MAG: hypothetical protein HQ481_13570 [Alphaproteobacteria bacterium]|nr:hypothetical protein [Alphaproteobacteria bacterium]